MHHRWLLGPVAIAILVAGTTITARAGTEASALRYGETYAYDAHDPSVAHGTDDAYDVSQSLSFRRDGTGTLHSEGSSRFRWHAGTVDGKPAILVGEYFDVRDPDGEQLTTGAAGLSPMRLRVSTDGTRLTDIDGGIDYLLQRPPAKTGAEAFSLHGT